jgi:hypothetical protein
VHQQYTHLEKSCDLFRNDVLCNIPAKFDIPMKLVISLMRPARFTFSFNLLGIRTLYMFRALLAHPQEALYKRRVVYACVLGQLAATRIGVELAVPPQSW